MDAHFLLVSSSDHGASLLTLAGARARFTICRAREKRSCSGMSPVGFGREGGSSWVTSSSPRTRATPSSRSNSGYDFPRTLDDHLRWMSDAGLVPEVLWWRRDLAVVRADLSNRTF